MRQIQMGRSTRQQGISAHTSYNQSDWALAQIQNSPSSIQPIEEPDRLDFVLEWPLREIQLHQLQQWEADGLLAAPQRWRFHDLQRLIQRHRATLDRLLAE